MTLPLFLGSLAHNSSQLGSGLDLLDQWDVLDASCSMQNGEGPHQWRQRQRQQLELLEVARHLYPEDLRLQNCHLIRASVAAPVGVYELPQGGLMFSNVQTCGRSYCPVCGPRIRSRRGKEFVAVAQALVDQGFGALRVDWTHGHDLASPLTEQIESQRALFQVMGSGRRALSQRLKQFGTYAGSRRALDYTYGASGHHLHAHSVLFLQTSAALPDLYSEIRGAYDAAAQQVGLRVGANAVHMAQIDPEGARYLHKLGLPSGMEHSGNSMPAQLLNRAGQGDADAGRTWTEYAQGMKGQRTVNTTPGLKARAIGTPLAGDGHDAQLAQLAMQHPHEARLTYVLGPVEMQQDRPLLLALDALGSEQFINASRAA